MYSFEGFLFSAESTNTLGKLSKPLKPCSEQVHRFWGSGLRAMENSTFWGPREERRRRYWMKWGTWSRWLDKALITSFPGFSEKPLKFKLFFLLCSFTHQTAKYWVLLVNSEHNLPRKDLAAFNFWQEIMRFCWLAPGKLTCGLALVTVVSWAFLFCFLKSK